MTETLPGTIPTVYQALTAARLEVGGVGKDGRAPAQMGGYQFRGVDAVVNACSAILGRHGVLVVPEVLAVERATTMSNKGASMLNVYVTTRFTFYGPAGDYVQATVLGEAADAGDKATSKAQSVALRVALLQALLLPTDDPDPDSQGYEREGRQQAAESSHGVTRPRAREGAQVPQERPNQPAVRPAHLGPFYDALAALTEDQKAWVRENWPGHLPADPRQMTTSQAAEATEWMLSAVARPAVVE